MSTIYANDDDDDEILDERDERIERKENYPLVELQLDMGIAYLLDGLQRETGLTPKPDTYNALMIGGSLNFFPFENLGIMAGYLVGTTRAGAPERLESLKLYKWSLMKPGLVLRFISKTMGTYIYIGPTIASLDLHPDYKTVLQTAATTQGLTLNFNTDSATGVSWFMGAMIKFFINKKFFIGFGIEVFNMNTSYTSLSQAFDGLYANVPLTVGVAF